MAIISNLNKYNDKLVVKNYLLNRLLVEQALNNMADLVCVI
jgi:hypothetical protein